MNGKILEIEIRNFKSLEYLTLPPGGLSRGVVSESEERLPLPKFSCLIGLNGAGKSSILHGVDFLSQLFRGDIDAWLNRRGWKAGDIKFNLPEKKDKTVFFRVVVVVDLWVFEWRGYFSANSKQCKSESLSLCSARDDVTASKIDVGDVPLLEVGKKMMTLYCDENGRGAPERIRFQYQGSILSQLEDHELGERMLFFRDFMRSISSLDLLSPNQMRLNYKRAENIGLGGEGLFAFIHALSHEKKDRFVAIMRRFYPALDSVSVLSKAYGWKQLVIDESFPDTGGVLKTEAHHINDGMLRLMGIVAQTLSEKRFLMFDEIENGFSPELIRELVQYLVREVEQQVLVTTHSPLVLNYLLDEEARESLFFVYKEEGRSKCVRFFDISEADERLQFMGPGEAYADTDLPRLVERLKTEERSKGEE